MRWIIAPPSGYFQHKTKINNKNIFEKKKKNVKNKKSIAN